jgi:hypothetical protein
MLASIFRFTPQLFALLAIIGFTSCETDFDPNAPYKETTVIYGLIDPQDTVHYVKVNKAFLNTKTNAMTIAATEPDSSYHYDSITVTLLELRKGPDSLVLNTFPMHPVRVNKEPGLFAYPSQVVYRTGRAKLNEQSIAKIEVKNIKTGKVVSGATSLIPFLCIQQMGSSTLPWGGDCKDPNNPALPVELEKKTTLSFNLTNNALIYKGVYKIYYTEVKQNDSVSKVLSFPYFPDQPLSGFANQVIIKQAEAFAISDFMDAVIDVSNDDNTTFRLSDSVVAVVTAGTKDLYTYISVNNVFSAVTQTRPEFTNIKGGGTGLFTSRRMQHREGYFPLASIDTLAYLYPHLKFRNR